VTGLAKQGSVNARNGIERGGAVDVGAASVVAVLAIQLGRDWRFNRERRAPDPSVSGCLPEQQLRLVETAAAIICPGDELIRADGDQLGLVLRSSLG
jgi:hypothetical protein